ncbi:Sir2 silent information regulator family NAD-dependent deacetylase [Eubacteriales bacterium OttesenSCG-928-A19]|nr:Sir2 silent information regulator family NAD-dependent deacetylase [Eubacteriales bacterium OttesenSCG-928-A19]
MKSTEGCSARIDALRQALRAADAILIGAGAGLSTSAGLTYSGERFERNFAPFIAVYHFRDMYAATFYPYDSPEAYWGYMSRHIEINRYAPPVGAPYLALLDIVKDRDYFFLTTNVDHQFQRAGVQRDRLFYTQGDYGLWQCSVPCHTRTYDNRDAVMDMLARQRDLRIPAELTPRCPRCGRPMSMNLRCDDTFVQDDGWYAAAGRYDTFVRGHARGRVLYLELGVGANTPGIIKYPFWRMTAGNPDATYACVNLGEAYAPEQIASRAICVNADVGQVIDALGAP